MKNEDVDVVIIGAGAAGLMCAIEAGKRGRRVLVLDHATKLAEKIRISGGGRCNFTNLYTAPEAFLSANPHFCKSALRRFSQHDFIAMVDAHGIAYHEKKLGQLFCNGSSQAIIDMLHDNATAHHAEIRLETPVRDIAKDIGVFTINTDKSVVTASSLVIATGGLSIPKIGASRFGYEVARKFGINVLETRPGLVPLTFERELLNRCKRLSGLSVEAAVSCGKTSFAEGLLFTHRGLSGPSILQISSYWRDGAVMSVDLLPGVDAAALLLGYKLTKPKADVVSCLSILLPKRLAYELVEISSIEGRIADCTDQKLRVLGRMLNDWRLTPAGSEGYRTAEVTLGGVDTDALSSKSMQVKTVQGLFFIGEVVDVTGHLGGYNFQWAWSSGYAAGQYA